MKSIVFILTFLFFISCQSSDSSNSNIIKTSSGVTVNHSSLEEGKNTLKASTNPLQEDKEMLPNDEKIVESAPNPTTQVQKKVNKVRIEKKEPLLKKQTKVETPKELPVKKSNTSIDNQVEKPIKAISFSHDAWDSLTRKHVSSNGKVDYLGFKSDELLIDNYIASLTNNSPKKSWSRNEKLAYWINVYNAYTVKLIVKNYPVSSINDINNGKPWDLLWINVGTKVYSLNQIENSIIRPRFNEPRIHFAVNCAAKSCPPILNRAWTKDNISSWLASQTIDFINDEFYNTISANKVEVSKIFEWYASDFGDLIPFLNKYSTMKILPTADINFKEYDWRLNN